MSANLENPLYFPPSLSSVFYQSTPGYLQKDMSISYKDMTLPRES